MSQSNKAAATDSGPAVPHYEPLHTTEEDAKAFQDYLDLMAKKNVKQLSPEELSDFYTTWSKTYDKMLGPSGRYNGPQMTADYVNRYSKDYTVKNREDIEILDVAAGTGLVALKLMEYGFKTIDALEPNPSMVEIAKTKGYYRKYYMEFLGDEPTTIPNDSYDFLVASAGFSEGLIPCSGLHDMARVVKPGGYVVIAFEEYRLSTVKEYIDRLEPLMAKMAEEKKWQREARDIIPNFVFDRDGVIFVYKVI